MSTLRKSPQVHAGAGTGRKPRVPGLKRGSVALIVAVGLLVFLFAVAITFFRSGRYLDEESFEERMLEEGRVRQNPPAEEPVAPAATEPLLDTPADPPGQ